MTPQLSSAPAARTGSRGFSPIRDLPTVGWLLLTAIAAIVHRSLPMPAWLLIHLLLLGAVTHAILVWSQYFSFALLRSRASGAELRAQTTRLVMSNTGAALVIAGVLAQVWALAVVGAALLIAAVAWHGFDLLLRLRRTMSGRFGHVIRYYVSSAALLVVGAALGAWLARGEGSANVVLSHVILNVLGWIGVTVAGTVVTLWPTILRTRAAERSGSDAARALPVLVAGVVVAAGGAGFGSLPVVTAGLAAYVVGLVLIGVSLVRAVRQKPPRSFSALSVGMALVWWAGMTGTIVAGAVTALVTGTGFAALADLIRQAVPYLAAGFAAQVLLGALSYLIPVVLGGGPAPVRAGTTAFDAAGPLRVTVANAALAVCALPVSSLTRVVASVLYLIAMASFLIVLVRAMRAQRRAKTVASDPLVAPVNGARRRGPVVPEGEQPRGRRAGQAIAGLIVVMLATTGVAAADPAGLARDPAASGDPGAPVQTVRIEAADMRFTPDRIEVPVGTRLIVEVVNTDDELVHDLVFENGVAGSRIAPGESDTIDVGVITEDLDGWCSIVGHKQMGMTLRVVATGGSPTGADEPGTDPHAGHDTGSTPDMDAEPSADFTPFDARLDALPASDGPETHEVTLEVTDREVEVAPGITQTLWTYNGSAPGPVLHGRVGDTFVVTLVNNGSMGHSIDFHAGALAPDEPMRTIPPGERLTYTFTATRAGIWMYHCSTMPMSVHIANGMYGAVVIEPEDLDPVDRSYVLVQGEYYLGDHDGGVVAPDKIATRNPDLVTFNGYANQYDYAPLPATVGERVRVWVLDAGIERPSSFHVVGGQFDTVWAEGAYVLDHSRDTGSQALGLQPAQGGFVELTFPEAGHYSFVSHAMIDAERGAHGVFDVTG